MPIPLYSRFFAQAIALVQCARNNPPVKKGSNAYCKSFLPFCLVTERVEVLPSCTSNYETDILGYLSFQNLLLQLISDHFNFLTSNFSPISF